jgi:hypothetical protein
MKNAIRRLCVVLAVAMGAGAVAVLISVAMHMTNLIWPDWLPYRLAGGGYERDIVQRIEAAEGFYKNHATGDERYLCAVIGLSGMREAGDLETMTKASDNKCRYIGLCGAGGAFDTLAEQTRRLLDGSLRPDVAVVGIAEFLLITPKPPKPSTSTEESSPWLSALRCGDIHLMAKMFKDGLWFNERRRDVNGTVEAFLMGAKQTMLRWLGATGETTNNPLLDPWREMIRMEVPEHVSGTALRLGVESFEARGAYDANSYLRERISEQVQALNSVISKLRERGSVVLVAVMPEHSALRSRIPEDGVKALQLALHEAFGTNAPPLIDLRGIVPDSGFTDVTHVNDEGRKIVSEALAAKITAALPIGKRPLMLQTAATGQ